MQDEAVIIMKEKLEVLDGIMHGYDYHKYFTSDTAEKLKIILESEDFILGIEQGEGKTRFIRAVSSLSQSFALAVPHPTAMENAPLVAYFQAVKARLVKFNEPTTNSAGIGNTELETSVRQTIDQALVSEKVVDIFDAAGIQKPDISILSDEFIEEMRDYEHKNIALETLKKLLNDEIKVREQHSFI